MIDSLLGLLPAQDLSSVSPTALKDFIIDVLRNNAFAQGGFVLGILSAIGYMMKVYLLIPFISAYRFVKKRFVDVLIAKRDNDELIYGLKEMEEHLLEHIWLNNVKIMNPKHYNDAGSSDIIPVGRFIGFSKKIGLFMVEKTREETDMRVRISLSVTTRKGMVEKLISLASDMKKSKGKDLVFVRDQEKFYFSKERKNLPFLEQVSDSRVLNTIIEDVGRVIGSSLDLKKHGMSSRRGICLYGPPGTGKSMFAYAIIKHFKEIESVLFLNGKTTLSTISQDIASKNGWTLVVLDDVDMLLDIKNRDNGEAKEGCIGRYSLVELMNMMSNPFFDNVIWLFTTNYVEKLDKALIRKGRIDNMIEVLPMSKEKKLSLIEKYPLAGIDENDSLSEISTKIASCVSSGELK